MFPKTDREWIKGNSNRRTPTGMSGYTKGASIAIQALQKLEDTSEMIPMDEAMLTLADLPPLDSTMARALRMDSVWDSTMRKQLREGLSGRPGTEHLRPSTRVAFPLRSIIEVAERLAATEAEDTTLAERHLASAMVERLGNALRELSINCQWLVAEVIAIERSPEERRIKQGLEWEELALSSCQMMCKFSSGDPSL